MPSDTLAVGRPRTTVLRQTKESPTTLRPMTLTALLQAHGSGYSREFVRESVLAWAAHRWPELFIGRNACEPTFESHSGRSAVQVTCTSNGDYTWSFKGIHADVTGATLWETRVLVLGNDKHDLLGISTGYLGDVDPDVRVAQPAFLVGLIEHLPFDDGGLRVSAAPRRVFDERALVNLQDHLLDQRRTLPILILGSSSPASESRDQEEPDRIEARAMARQLCGLAHVVCLGPLVVALLENRLGGDMGVHAGEARLYLPERDDADRAQGQRSARAFPRTRRFVAGDAGAAARAATHAWSVSAPRRRDFNSLWTSAVAT